MSKSTLFLIIATLAMPVIAVASDTAIPEDRVRMLDTDADNQVSLVEFLAAGKPQEEFVELDTDSDGYATVTEFRTQHLQPPGVIDTQPIDHEKTDGTGKPKPTTGEPAVKEK